jgi:TetR/AcrR family transcriptional regulator, transcriptional repressor for nem operon
MSSKSERTRQFIIEQAAPVFNRKGIAGTAISDIMEVTKLAKGGIYGNFDSKEEITREVCNYLVKRRGAQLSGALARDGRGGPTATGRLFSLLDFMKEDLLDNFGGCPIISLGTEIDDTDIDPVIRKRLTEAIAYCQSIIRAVVQQGIDAGEFDPSVDAELFGIKAFALLEGAALFGRIQGNDSQMAKIIGVLRTEIRAWAT